LKNWFHLLLILPLPGLALGPRSGDVYREYYVAMGGGKDWRVTQPQPKHKNAWLQLPNSTLRVLIGELRNARKAEIQIDRWGGHYGTTGKRIRFNGKPWITVPELATTPAGHDPSCYMFEDNPIVEVPLADLREGENSLEGTAGDQGCDGFGWGQWGWYGAILRIYYEPGKAPAAGRISNPRSGSSFEDHPVIQFRSDDPSQVDRVDVLAWFDGADENGDGVFQDWHHSYRSVDLTGHAGTAMAAPFAIPWDTSWVPDQKPRTIKLMARVRDRSGLWTVTPAVDNLTLRRREGSVALYRPENVPEKHWVRANRSSSSQVTIPPADLKKRVVDASLAIRSWNGHAEKFRFNDAQEDIDGADHAYAMTFRPVPKDALRPGSNTITFHSTTDHHGPEILWPGPMLLVRYGSAPPKPAGRPQWLNGDYRSRLVLKVSTEVPLAAGKAVEFDLDAAASIDPASLRAIECADAECSSVKDYALTAQLDVSEGGKGAGVVLLRSALSPGSDRFIHLYFRERGASGISFLPPALVSLEDNVEHAGQSSSRVTTPVATFVYHKEGAGFASLYDRDRNDWIGYAPGNRSAGEFRGIPNLGPYFHPGYAGEKGSRTTVLSGGPARVRLHSETNDGKFAALWDFFPGYARMTLLRANQPYWFLYEGTPGGKLDVDHDYWVGPGGQRRSVSEMWTGDFEGPERVFFGDGRKERVLFLANHQDDAANDQFYQMENNMTVFGFGRQHRCCGRYLTAVPAEFTIGLIETSETSRVSHAIASAVARPKVEKLALEARPDLRAPSR